MPRVRTYPKPQRARHFIREWRKHRGYTIEELADLVGVTHGAISQLERGRINYTQPMLEALAGVLHCKPHDLIARRPDDEPELMDMWSGANADEKSQIRRVLEALLSGRKAS